jgi:hypothetical protein
MKKQKTPKIRFGRLAKLAKHLEVGKLYHDTFDFSVYHQENECGTAGCALGECPKVFGTRVWQLRQRWCGSMPHHRNFSGIGAASLFFGITQEQAIHLFVPGAQRPLLFEGEALYGDATREQVAANIRAFITKLKK